MSTSTSRPYTPPLFSNFGKSTKDLLKKKYDYNQEFKVVGPRTKLGLNVESGVVADKKSNGVRAYVKSSYAYPDLGVWDSELHTDANQETKSTFTFNKFVKGLQAKLGYTTHGTRPKAAFKNGHASFDLDYSQDYVAASAKLQTNSQVTLAESTIALGYDGLAIGAKAEFDMSHSAKLEQVNFGAEYSQADFTASVMTDRSRDGEGNKVTASYFQRLAADHVVGASLTADLKSGSRSLALGTDFRLDVDTLFRTKAEIASDKSAVTLSTAVEHRLAKPNAKLAVASELKVVPGSAIEATNLGINLTFGDF